MGTKKLPGTLSGVSGEYFVAAELSRQGFIASITLRNTAGIDILVSNARASKTVGIQVKTTQGSRPAWVLSKKAETYFAPSIFYVFVVLKDGLPDFHVVRSKVVVDSVRIGHAEWLKTPGRGGREHKDTDMRMFDDPEGKYLNRWDLLRL